MPQLQTYPVSAFVFKALVAASVTTSAATAFAIGTITRSCSSFAAVSTLNQACMLTVNNVDFMPIGPSSTTVLNLPLNSFLPSGSAGAVIGIYSLGAAPASGLFAVSCY